MGPIIIEILSILRIRFEISSIMAVSMCHFKRIIISSLCIRECFSSQGQNNTTLVALLNDKIARFLKLGVVYTVLNSNTDNAWYYFSYLTFIPRMIFH